MKRLLCLTAALALMATSASAQFVDSVQQGMAVSFRDTSTAEGESRTLAELIYRALDKSRSLRLVPVLDDNAMELEAPRALVKEAEGARITVRYEISPPRGSDREYTATCSATQLQRCADAIVQRAERVAREAGMAR